GEEAGPGTARRPRLREAHAVVAGTAADVEHAHPIDRHAALERLLVAQPHALAEHLVDEALQRAARVPVQGVEVDGVALEEALGAADGHEGAPIAAGKRAWKSRNDVTGKRASSARSLGSVVRRFTYDLKRRRSPICRRGCVGSISRG